MQFGSEPEAVSAHARSALTTTGSSTRSSAVTRARRVARRLRDAVRGLSALTAGQVVEIVYYEKFVLADTVSKASGGTFAKAIAVNGDLTVDTDTLYVDSTNAE